MRKMYVASFQSRAKDNTHLDRELLRKRFFVISEEDIKDLDMLFQDFVDKGVESEVCRCYISYNPVDEEVIKKDLCIKLLSDENVKVDNMQNVLVSITQKAKALTKKWLFDFDYTDGTKLQEFLTDISIYFDKEEIEVIKTPNGYSVIVLHGFDTREILSKYELCENKKTGGLKFVKMLTK